MPDLSPPAPRRVATAAARHPQVREHNLALALGQVVDARSPVSRAEIAAATGLARATVSALADQLIEAGLVAELAPVPVQRAGRPAVPLVPASGTVAGVGMEVNVDYLGVRAVDLAGRVLVERVEHVDLRGSDPAHVLGRLAALAGEALDALGAAGVRVAGTALALPGLVDRITGPLRVAPNLGWRDVDVAALLAVHPAFAGLPPRLANEANLAARAEAHARRGPRPPSFVYVSGEIGIGGAIVLDGEVFLGRHGWGGEIGHTVVDRARPTAPSGGLDGTSARGGVATLETLAGQDALLRGAGLPTSAPVTDLVAACDAGDERALASVLEAAGALGVALANVVNVVDVGEIVLGGTFGLLYGHVHGPVAAELDRHVIHAAWSAPTVSEPLAGDYPAMSGGALAVLRTVVAAPAPWLRPPPARP